MSATKPDAPPGKKESCLYITWGRTGDGAARWRVGQTTRPSRRPHESYEENRGCLGDLESVSLVCGISAEHVNDLELRLIDILTEVLPEGRCNLVRR